MKPVVKQFINRRIFVLMLFMTFHSLAQAQDKKVIVEDTSEIIVIETKKPKPLKNEDDIRFVLLQSILKGQLLNGLVNLPTDNAHISSIAISFDLNGAVDSIYFSSKMTTKLRYVLGSVNRLKVAMKNSVKKFNNYKNVVVLFPVIFHNMDHRKIDKDIFIEDYLNLWPDLSKEDRKKKIEFLEPYVQGIRMRY
jgi:hypothetical protein